MKQIYLDYAASTPIDKAVLKEMQKALKLYANPSSMHSFGIAAQQTLQQARQRIANILHCKPTEIIFTSGGTESNNLALQGLARSKAVSTMITTPIEHLSILNTAEYLQQNGENGISGINLQYICVDKTGKIDLTLLEQMIIPNCLISIGYVNNELGVVQDVQAIAAIIQKKRKEFDTDSIYFHIDACQAEFQELNIEKLHVDLLTLNAAKLYGPKGAGLLYVRENTLLQPLLLGGEQENNHRAGTENLAVIIGFAKALEINERIKKNERKRIFALYAYFIKQLRRMKDVTIHSQQSHIVNVTFSFCDAQTILKYLDSYGIYAAAGSACTAQEITPSHVLTAIGLSQQQAQATLRFSLGRNTTKKEIDIVVKKLQQIVESLRKIS